MFKTNIFLLSMLSLSFAAATDSTRVIDVLNDSTKSLRWNAQASDNSFAVNQTVPAHAKAFVIAQVTTLSVVQDKLFGAIFRDSAEEVRQAIAAGADVNKKREGKTPLSWALKYSMVNAATCLVQHGAHR